MTKSFSKFVLLAGVAPLILTSALSSPAAAKDLGEGWLAKERFQVRLRGIGILPEKGGSTSIGGETEAENAYVPEVDLTYFLDQNWALELIAATAKHDIKAIGTTSGDLDLGDTMLLPPTLTLQYHFTPDNALSPYVGAGINYSMTYSEDDGADTNVLDADNGFGWALQAGADYWLDEHWGLNFDVKKLWVDVDAKINNGAITGNVELDPWIIGTGVSYRF